MLEVWDAIICVVLAIIAVSVPYEAAFSTWQPSHPTRLPYDSIIDLVLLSDMVIQFMTAYPDAEGKAVYVRDPHKIAVNYLCGWFAVDVLSVSTLPLLWLNRVFKVWNSGTMQILCLIRLLRLHSVLQIARRRHSSVGVSYAVFSLTKFVCGLTLCCHWMGCLWGGVAFHTQDSHTWLHALRAAKGGPSELYSTPRSVYSMSLYWAIMTLTSIGYGDITPQSELEYWVSCLCMGLMASTWAYVIGEVCGVVSTMMPHDVAFQRTMDDLNWIMQDRNMPSDMRQKLRRYFHESRSLYRLQEQRSIIAQMSPMLQGEISTQLLGDWLHMVPYLVHMDPDILVQVARMLNPMLYAPNEIVRCERSLFVVRRGICLRKGRVHVADDVWGADMILSNIHLRDHCQARCLSYLEVLTLRNVDLMRVVRESETDRARLRWCQIKLGIQRGFLRLAAGIRELERNLGVKCCNLSQKTWFEILTKMLDGTFTGEIPKSRPPSRKASLVLSETAGSRTPVDGSPVRRGSVVMMVGDQEVAHMKDSLAQLQQTVEALQETVLTLAGNN